ncbi:siderophore-interacting protein [Pelagibacterium sp.]|uniref:siderophore-interacting protein n=1 Tax=Pelagibacterium sp. TaxID=1967288 RepID=UPI003A95711C
MEKMFYDVTLLDRQVLTPGMVRLTFGGEGLRTFRSTGIADEYLRLFFPNSETGKLHLPHISDDGRWTYPDGQDSILCSTYTVRRYVENGDDITIDIDFVVHAGGLASEWAQNAPLGAHITINKPRGLYDPPSDLAWQLLVADATGLPALSRILEQTPQHVQSRVFVEVAQAQDEQILPLHEAATVTWLHGCGNGVAPSRLEEIVRSVPLPATPGYVWVAGEQKVVRGIRKFVRKELGFPPQRYELIGYWIANSEDWEAKWEALDPAIKAKIDAGWDSGRDRETLMDEYNETLEKHGL